MAKALDRIGTASRTSSLKRWMLRNREEFAAKLAEAKPPDWHAITRILDAEGLTLTGDKPLNVQAVKVLWGRVSKEAMRPVKPAKPVEVPPAPLAVIAEPSEPDPELPPIEDRLSAGLSWLEKLRKKKE